MGPSLRLPTRLCYCARLPCTAATSGCNCMMSNSAPTARPTAGAPLSSRLLALVFAATSLAGCGQRVPGTPPAAATEGAPAAAAA
ncbi:lipoprotein, partial [Xanthomonas oryzae]